MKAFPQHAVAAAKLILSLGLTVVLDEDLLAALVEGILSAAQR